LVRIIEPDRLKAELQTLGLMAMSFRRMQRRNAQLRRFGKAVSSGEDILRKCGTRRHLVSHFPRVENGAAGMCLRED
jgi:hypothetical protein